MENLLADMIVSMSEFKKNPAAVLRVAANRPVAVLNHNKPAFYLIEPRLYEAMMNEAADLALYRKVLSRIPERAKAIEVDIDEE